jgi:hypothetical protein
VTPDGEVLWCDVASLPALGNSLVISGDGDATIRIEVPPTAVAELAPLFHKLRNRTFFVAIIAKGKAHDHGTQAGVPVPEAHAAPARRASRAKAARRPAKRGGGDHR